MSPKNSKSFNIFSFFSGICLKTNKLVKRKSTINYLFAIGFLLSFTSHSQTTLTAGDIAILQYNADGTTMKFMAMRSMEAGTTINFTDNGWRSDNTFRTGEGIDVWTAPTNIVSGDIITFTFTNVSLATNGDQLLAYQGASTFIYAINNQGAGVWQSNANNGSNSALPLGLTNGTNAVAVTETDNVIYDSSTLTGSKAAILSAISNNANWGGSNTVTQNFASTFTSEATWTGSWDGTGTPSDYFKAVISANISVGFTANELQVDNGVTVTVGSGVTVDIQNSITNNGTILVQSGGSLIQTISDGANTTGAGTYTVERASTTLANRYDFTYWSSPTTNATLAEISPDGNWYYFFTAATQAWTLGSSSTTATPGLGYAVQGRNAGHTYPGTYTASFSTATGAFNNGDIVTTLGFTDDADAETDYNLLGNPYPSAISAVTFLDNNPALGSTIYFWTHSTATSATANTDADYAMYTNGSGGTASVNGGTTPDGNIASGQGFFAQAVSAGSATFTNSMRVTGNNTNFYRAANITNNEVKDRIWLNLTSDNSFSQILIAFVEGATNGIDKKYDGLRLDGGAKANFYSLIDGKNYGIQGKEPLTPKEEIPLGFYTTKNGEFTISIDHFERKLQYSYIYLVDKELDVVHDLNAANYTFTIPDANASYDDRFVLRIVTNSYVFYPEGTAAEMVVTQHENQLEIITSNHDMISNVIIYDLLGREIIRYEGQPSDKIVLPSSKIAPASIFIIKTVLEKGYQFSEKHFKN